MELARRWLETQRSTPSFAHGSNDVAASMAVDVLAMSLPVGLRGLQESNGEFSSAPAVRRAVPIHDDLIAKGQLYEQRREALQEKAIQEQLKTVTKSPRISADAKALRRDEPFENRFRRLEREKVEKQRHTIHKLEKEDDVFSRYSFKPKISNRGRRATSRLTLHDQHDAWSRRREERLEALRAQKIIADLADVRDGPDINPTSQHLALRRREQQGLSGLSHIDAMIERDRLQKLAAWERSQMSDGQQNWNPKITAFAAAMTPRDDHRDVFERLYDQTFQADERRATLIRQRLEEETCSPAITAAANASQRRSRHIEDDLMQRHLDSLAAREQAMRDVVLRDTERRTPAINPVSDVIASRLPTTPRERLLMGKSQPQDPDTVDVKSARSSSVASSTVTSRERERQRNEILSQQEARRKERLALLEQQKLDREMAECTFRPITHVSESRNQGAESSGLYERSLQWNKKHELKMEEQRMARANAEVAGCTFTPTRSQRTGSLRSSSKLYAEAPWGTEEFLERQQEARRMQLEREKKLKLTGEKWKYGVTVPQEFNLGERRGGNELRALYPPVAVPAVPITQELPPFAYVDPTSHDIGLRPPWMTSD